MMVDVLTDVRCWLNESGDVQLFLQARCATNGPALDAPRGRVGEAFELSALHRFQAATPLRPGETYSLAYRMRSCYREVDQCFYLQLAPIRKRTSARPMPAANACCAAVHVDCAALLRWASSRTAVS